MIFVRNDEGRSGELAEPSRVSLHHPDFTKFQIYAPINEGSPDLSYKLSPVDEKHHPLSVVGSPFCDLGNYAGLPAAAREHDTGRTCSRSPRLPKIFNKIILIRS